MIHAARSMRPHSVASRCAAPRCAALCAPYIYIYIYMYTHTYLLILIVLIITIAEHIGVREPGATTRFVPLCSDGDAEATTDATVQKRHAATERDRRFCKWTIWYYSVNYYINILHTPIDRRSGRGARPASDRGPQAAWLGGGLKQAESYKHNQARLFYPILSYPILS